MRAAEAAALLAAGLWDGAYYLAGYAVECALKACIAKLTKAEDFPPPRKVIEQCYTHDLKQLVERAGLADDLATARVNPAFDLNWRLAAAWAEDSRYERRAESDARALWSAITDPTNGVLPWVKFRW